MPTFYESTTLERFYMKWFLTQVGINTWEPTPDFGFDRYDCTFSGCIAEVKCRTKICTDPAFRLTVSDIKPDADAAEFFALSAALNKNPRYGYLIEKSKWEFLMSQPGLVPLYINFFPDRLVKVFRLDKHPEPVWGYRYCPKTTCGDSTYKNKLTGLLEVPIYSKQLLIEYRPNLFPART